jgi:hypothetical protein
MKKEQFCYICCDKEIGPSNTDSLDCCYKRCETATLNKNKCDRFYEIFHIVQIVGSGLGIPQVPIRLGSLIPNKTHLSDINPVEPLDQANSSVHEEMPLLTNDYKVEDKIKDLTGYEAV